MALEPRFNFDFNTTVIDSAADIKAQRQMQNIASKESQRSTVGDFINVVGKGAEVYNSIQAAEDVGQGAKAQEHYTALINSDGYLQANDTAKFDMLQNVLNLAPEQGEAYATTMAGIMSSNMSKVYKGMNNERIEGAVLLSYTDSIRYAEQSGKNHDDWVNDYVARFPYLKDSKKELNMAVLGGMLLDGVSEIQEARNPEELNEALLNITDRTKGLDTPHIFGSKNADMVSYLKRMRKTYEQAVSAKNKEFKNNATTEIVMLKKEGSEIIEVKYAAMPTDETFKRAYPDTWEQEKQKFGTQFEIYEKVRTDSQAFDPESMTDWKGQNDIGKKMYQQAVDMQIIGSLENGSIVDNWRTIYQQGSIDTKRLTKSRQTIASMLGNNETAESTLKQLLILKEAHPEAFNALFPDSKERGKILAMNAISQTFSIPPSEARLYMNKTPDFTMHMTRSEKEEMGAFYSDSDISIPLRSDAKAMMSVLSTYGLEYSVVKEIIDGYVESNPYRMKLEEKYSPELVTMLEEKLDGFNSYRDAGEGTMFSNPYTNSIHFTDMYGNTTKIVDEDELVKYVSKVENIQKYQDEHWFMRWGEDVLDTLSTAIAAPISYQLTRAGALATSINHAFMTKITTDGELGKRTNLPDKLWLGTQTKDKRSKSPHVRDEPYDVSSIDWSTTYEKVEVQKDGPYAKGKGYN